MKLNDPPDEVLDSAIKPFTSPPESDDDSAPLTRQFVTFRMADAMFAVRMTPVQEIIRVPEVTHMPLAPPALEGLTQLRGRVLPIVSLRHLLGMPPRDHDDASRALVINLGQPLGFVVDKVASVISVEPADIKPADSIQSVVQADHLTGVIQRVDRDGQPQLLLVLDFDTLVRKQFAQLAEQQLDGDSAGPAGTPNSPAAELRLVSFTVAGQEYAIDIADVQEIVQVPDTITRLPRTEAHVLGLISLRQRLLPLLSLRALFALPADALDEHHRIVVVSLPDGSQVGLVSDTVKEVLSVQQHQADAMPTLLACDAQLQEFESICRLDQGRRLVTLITARKLRGLHMVQDALRAAASAHGREHRQEQDTVNHSRAHDLDSDRQMVIFRLGAEEFGVPIMSVQEIVRVPDTLTRLPRTPDWVEGVINLRGTVLPVVDQRTRLGMPPAERQDRQRILVYLLSGLRIGFIVDSVADVLRIALQHIEPAPRLSTESALLITQVAKLDGDQRLVLLIDPNHLLGGQEASAMRQMMHLPEAA